LLGLFIDVFDMLIHRGILLVDPNKINWKC
jgi:hypothetical protein